MRSSKQQRRYLPCLVLFLLLPVTVSSSALAQEEELSLEALPGLNTQKPPKKAPAKKKAGKEKDSKEAAAPDVELGGAVIALPPSESSELALPEPTTLNPDARIAVIFVRTPLVDEATATQLDSALRAVAFLAPLSQNPTVLRPALDAPESSICHADDDSCFVNMAAKDGADSVAVATISKTKSGMNIRVRRLAVRTRKSLGEASAESPNDPVALKAQTEALLCEQLVPDGCANEIQIDTSGAEILYEGRVLPRGKYVPMRVVLPVGLAPLSARLKGKTGAERLVPVLREKMSGVAISVRFERDGTPLMLSPVEAETYRPPPPPALPQEEVPPDARWPRPVGFAVVGAGGALLLTAILEGAHSKSLLSDARAAYNSNGGAYRPADLDGLRSGNSAAHTANILYLASAIAAAAGLTVALEF
jgi:hypothetical protein